MVSMRVADPTQVAELLDAADAYEALTAAG